VKVASGEISVPASSVSDTNRLTIVSVKYSPSAIHGKAPITLTVKVTDVNKYVISGVLVYVLPVPSNWAAKTPEVATGADGTASIRIQPTLKTPKRSLVLFVRVGRRRGTCSQGRRLAVYLRSHLRQLSAEGGRRAGAFGAIVPGRQAGSCCRCCRSRSALHRPSRRLTRPEALWLGAFTLLTVWTAPPRSGRPLPGRR
jgi:hypothetical protein